MGMGKGIGLTNWGSTNSTIDGESPAEPTGADGGEAFHALGSSPDAPRLLVFTVAGKVCAVELSSVREIIPCRKATRLPGAPPFVIGLINLRGSIITVLDLGVRLDGEASHGQAAETHASSFGEPGAGDCRDRAACHRAAHLAETGDNGS